MGRERRQDLLKPVNLMVLGVSECVCVKKPEGEIHRKASCMAYLMPVRTWNRIEIEDFVTADKIIVVLIPNLSWKLIGPFVKSIRKYSQNKQGEKVLCTLHGLKRGQMITFASVFQDETIVEELNEPTSEQEKTRNLSLSKEGHN